jgi:hypothetical protein
MFALVGLVRNLGGGPVVVHRLGRRHIGTRPFETKWERVQIEAREFSEVAGQNNARIMQYQQSTKCSQKKKEKPIRKQNSPVEDKRAVSASLGNLLGKKTFFSGASRLLLDLSVALPHELFENGRFLLENGRSFRGR